jgi:hypothetical protein
MHFMVKDFGTVMALITFDKVEKGWNDRYEVR